MFLIQCMNLKRTLIFEWCMVRCESKIIYQTNMCWKGTGLCVQRLLAILDVIIDLNEGHIHHSIIKTIFTLTMNRIFIQASNIIEASGYGHDLDLLTISH
jgi:hypothetical protein